LRLGLAQETPRQEARQDRSRSRLVFGAKIGMVHAANTDLPLNKRERNDSLNSEEQT
jgi:hypothetical protein